MLKVVAVAVQVCIEFAASVCLESGQFWPRSFAAIEIERVTVTPLTGQLVKPACRPRVEGRNTLPMTVELPYHWHVLDAAPMTLKVQRRRPES